MNTEEKSSLLEIVRNHIKTYFDNSIRTIPDENEVLEELKIHRGAFVSIYVNNDLNGCIGSFEANQPLFSLVCKLAFAAAFNDSRFEVLSRDDLNNCRFEISVLSPMNKVNDINDIIVGKHGIYLKKGFQAGTYLPQVAPKCGWDREEMLRHCAHDKAGLDWEAWRSSEIYTYEAESFSD